jgi:hypothetical protein
VSFIIDSISIFSVWRLEPQIRFAQGHVPEHLVFPTNGLFPDSNY